jgi:hypothetical protein
LANKLLPEVVLTVCLVLLLALTTKEMLEKGFEAWAAETKAEAAAQQVKSLWEGFDSGTTVCLHRSGPHQVSSCFAARQCLRARVCAWGSTRRRPRSRR